MTNPTLVLHFGLIVKQLRLQQQLSQEELANRCGLHRTYITDIEHGTRNVSLNNIGKIASALNVPLEEMFGRIEQYTRDGLTLVSHTPTDVRRSRRNPVEILLVEDDQSYIELTLHELHRMNISNRIHVARNGAETLELLFAPPSSKKHPTIGIPKIVLLDLYLPLMNGLEVLEQIRKNERTKDIAVVVMTSSNSDLDKKRCRELGVVEYLTKPINGINFSAVMRRLGFEMLLFDRKRINL